MPLFLIFILNFFILIFINYAAPIDLLLMKRFLPGFEIVEIIILCFYGVWVGKNLLNLKKTASTRSFIWIVFSIVFFLQFIIGILGIEKLLMTGKIHLPVPALIIAGSLYRLNSFFMPILFLSIIILVGPAWCSYLCYIGAWDNKMSAMQNKKSKPLPGWAKILRLIILILTILLPVIFRYFHISMYVSLIVTIVFGLIGVFIIFVISRKMGVLVHCTTYCPIGLVANIIGKISPWRIRISSQCNKCGKCSHACRYDALNSDHIDKKKVGFSCTLCGDCLAECKNGYITYSFLKLSSSTVRSSFIVLITILHTIFIAVARL